MLHGGSAMDDTLNLVDHLLTLGRRYQQMGRHHDALRLLTRLSGFRELPAEAAEETQARLAELCLKRRKYARARRHLTAALRHQPDNPRYHYLLASSLRAEDRGHSERALSHYRRALELEPEHVKCLCECGLLLVRLGQFEEGLDYLRRAVEKAPENADVLARLVKGLRLADRGDEARSALRAALFRNSRSPRFRRLWQEYQFQQLRREQEEANADDAEEVALNDEPVLLPFIRPLPASAAEDEMPANVRHDEPSVLPGPYRPHLLRRPDQRFVQ
jgi:tetratricopeptide (TPR) repeat protein